MNAINDWIRAGDTHKGKKQRRLIIAGACFTGAALCTLAAPVGLVGTAILGAIGAVKIKNALTDNT